MQNIVLGLIGAAFYIVFLLMFIRAAWTGDFIFRFGRIRGNLARAIGVFGLVGMAASTYLAVSIILFDELPPFATIAIVIVVLLFVLLLVIRFLSLFMFHEK